MHLVYERLICSKERGKKIQSTFGRKSKQERLGESGRSERRNMIALFVFAAGIWIALTFSALWEPKSSRYPKYITTSSIDRYRKSLKNTGANR